MGWFRNPKTTNERRQWFSALEVAKEYPHKFKRPRASRSAGYGGLPDSYDDIHGSCYKCWKYYRKTQYREKKK